MTARAGAPGFKPALVGESGVLSLDGTDDGGHDEQREEYAGQVSMVRGMVSLHGMRG